MSRLDATLRGLSIFALVWQGLWLISDANLRSIVLQSPTSPAVIALVAAMVLWLALWPSLIGPLRDARRSRALQQASMTLIVFGGLMLLADIDAVQANGWFVGASVINLGAGLAGLYLRRRAGIAVVIAIAVIETVIILVVHPASQRESPLSVDLVYPFYALALGLASVASRHALTAAARRNDMSSSQLARQLRARQSSELIDSALTEAETRLHESVLNTLTAIVRGGLPQDSATSARMRARARESVNVLRAIAGGTDSWAQWSGDLRIDLAGAIRDLETGGARVRARGVLDVDALDHRIDEPSFAAMGSAVREALINASRHARAGLVSVDGRVQRRDGRSWWRVRIGDDGRGFDVGRRGYGLTSVVSEGIEALGGEVTIESRPGLGTDITIALPLTGTPSATQEAGVPARAVGVPVVTAFSAFTVYSIGVTWQYVTVAWANAAAVAVYFAITAVLLIAIIGRRREHLAWWAVLVVAVGVPVSTRLEYLAQPMPNPTGDWTSEAGAVLLFVIAATGPLWAVPIALASWFIAQELQWIELTQPGTIVIVVGALLGWQLRKVVARTAGLDREVDQEREALAITQQRLAQARARYRDVDTSGLITLLQQVAEGSVDPTTEEVRSACLREERMIRSVLRLHPERIGVHRDLVSMALVARDCGIDLSIVASDDIPGQARLATVEQCAALVRSARPGSQARASVTPDEQGWLYRFVVEVKPEVLAGLPDGVEVLDGCLVSIEERCEVAPNAQRSTDGG